MRVFVEENNHQILIERSMSGAKLVVDETEFKGPNILSASVMDFEITGRAVNDDGSEDEVKAVVKIGLLTDKIDIFYNGKRIYAGESLV